MTYKNPEGIVYEGHKQRLMGDVSNLITDMTLRGANREELTRAIRHSMVVIDSEKHNLNYKQSAIDNGIRALKEKYQRSPRGGASTIISSAKSRIDVPDRKPRPQSQGGPIDRVTGERVYVPTHSTRLNRNTGERVAKTLQSKKLAETNDAHTLSSGTPIEHLYAEHSNKLKALANQARLSMLSTPRTEWAPSAKKHYNKEVASLEGKLKVVVMNRPLERHAQTLAKQVVDATKAAHPHLDPNDIKKVKFKALEEARLRLNTKGKSKIFITDGEWTAIQAGAISDHMLNQILKKADLDRVRELATPRNRKTMTKAKTSRAHSMLNSGYTRAAVAQALGVSISTLDLATSGDATDEGD